MNITFVAGFFEDLRGFIGSFFAAILSFFPKLLYALCTFVFSIMDILQILIRKIAGLDVVYYTTSNWEQTGAQSGDIVLKFIQNIFLGQTPILTNVFWAMMILGMIMLFLTTLIAVFRSEYATMDSKSSSKGKIIGQAFKAIASFAVVPIVAFFGVFLANVILQAIDSATTDTTPKNTGIDMSTSFVQGTTSSSKDTYMNYCFYGEHLTPTTSTPISGQIFLASAYKANRIRYYELSDHDFFWYLNNKPNVDAGIFGNITGKEESAAFLDACFANSYVLKNGQTTLSTTNFENDYLFPLEGNNAFSNSDITFEVFDKNNVALVWYYYDLWSFDFIVCVAVLVVVGKLLIDLVFGLMKRIVELVILLLIAPPISALMPLDNGEALKKWRGKFIGKTIGAYGPVAGINLVFIILPVLSTIEFFSGLAVVNKIVNLLFLIVGLLMIKDLSAMISELVGGEDSLKSGEGMAKSVGDTLANVGKVATAPARLAVRTAKFAGATGKFIGGKISQHREKRAEEGKILSDIMGDKDKKEAFGKLSGLQQSRALKDLRRNMSDEDRSAAHGENERAYRQFRFRAKPIGKAKDDHKLFNGEDLTVDNLKNSNDRWSARRRGSKAVRAFDAANRDLTTAEGIKASAKTTLTATEANPDYISATTKSARKAEIEKLFNEGKISASTRASRLRGTTLTSDENAAVADVGKAKSDLSKAESDVADAKKRMDTAAHSPILGGVPVIKKLTERYQRYETFSEGAFGAEGTAKRAESDLRIAKQKAEEKKIGQEFWKESKGFLNNFKDSIGAVAKTLGGEFAKGWKDAGGWGDIVANLRGFTAKEQSLAAEVKNQKKLLSAQDKASDLLGRGGGKSSKIDLSDASVEALAEAIAKKVK